MNHTRIIRYLNMFSVIATQLSPTHLRAGLFSFANKEQTKRQQQSTKDKPATASINFSKWSLSALALGGIAYGLYYLFSTPKAAPVPQQKPRYIPPNNQPNTKCTGYPKKQFSQQSQPNTKPHVNPHKQNVPNNLPLKQLALLGAPANFSHTGPICYRNSLFQVICHADGIAPAIFAELQKSKRKEKTTQELYTLMLDQNKVKNWENYPNLHKKLFEDIGEYGTKHGAQDPVNLFSYWNLLPEEEINAILAQPFKFSTKLPEETNTINSNTILVQENLQASNFAPGQKITVPPQCLCLWTEPETKTRTIPQKYNLEPLCTSKQPQMYDCVGVVAYTPGHYIAYIRRNNSWYRCDDYFGGPQGSIRKIANPFDQNNNWKNLVEQPRMLFYAKI